MDRDGIDTQIEAERTKQRAEDRKLLFDIATDTIDALIELHKIVLIGKCNRGIIPDEYGRQDRSKWLEDCALFYDEFCRPAVLTSRSPFDFGWMSRRLSEPGVREGLIEYIDVVLGPEAARKRNNSVALMSPEEYERFCAFELQLLGWKTTVTAGSGDQGVDVVARVGNFTAVFQCKLYMSTVGNAAVQEINAGRMFYNADLAAVISNSEFTPGARVAAAQTKVMLLHHSQIRDLFAIS